MSCHLYRSLCSDHLDGLLSADEERALEVHLSLCRACREHQEETFDLKHMLADSLPLEPAPDLAEEILERVESEEEGPFASLRRSLADYLPRHPLVPSTTAAGLVLLLLFAVSAGPFRPAVEPPRPSETSWLTIWDSSAETITASVDPTGLTDARALPARCAKDGGAVDRAPAAEVRICLFERIEVRR